jgi:hypothetical protein
LGIFDQKGPFFVHFCPPCRPLNSAIFVKNGQKTAFFGQKMRKKGSFLARLIGHKEMGQKPGHFPAQIACRLLKIANLDPGQKRLGAFLGI